MEERMAEFGAKIDELHEKLDSMKEQAAVKYQDLKDKQRVASCKFKELKETSADAFSEFKTGMDHAFEELTKAWEEMKTGCSNAAAKFEK
jgi:DNA-binding ferritin-like protein